MTEDIINRIRENVIQGRLTQDDEGMDEGLVGSCHDLSEGGLFVALAEMCFGGDLGAEVEFWMGGGEARDSVVINTSSAIYVPPGLAHFPQIWRNVKRPVMTIVMMPDAKKRVIQRVSV